MTTTRLTALLLTALVMAAATCAAQQGPKPGYDDPLDYAQDYYTQEAENASADPAGYATGHASAEAVANETGEAAYIACWTAWHHSDGASEDAAGPVCDAYFTPPGEVSGEVPHHEANLTAANVTAVVNDTVPGSDEFLNETLDALNDTLADPANATTQLQRILNATLTFLGDLLGPVFGLLTFAVGLVQDIIDDLPPVGAAMGDAVENALLIVGGLLGLPILGAWQGLQMAGSAWAGAVTSLASGALAAVEGIGAGVAAAGQGILAALGAIGAALAATGAAVVSVVSSTLEGLQSVGSSAADGVGTAVDGVVAAIGAAAGGLAAAGSALLSGIGTAAGATGDGIATAAGATSDGVAAAAGAAGDGLMAAMGATGDGVAAVAGGIGDAADAVGDAVAEAAESVRDTVAGWFGAEDAGDSGRGLDGTADDLTDTLDDDGLLDGVTDLL